MSMGTRGSDPTGSKNKFDNSRGGGWSPPSGKGGQNPPAAGAHAPKDVQRIKGGGGSQGAGVHESLRK